MKSEKITIACGKDRVPVQVKAYPVEIEGIPNLYVHRRYFTEGEDVPPSKQKNFWVVTEATTGLALFQAADAAQARIAARGNWREVEITTSKEGNPLIRFKSNINIDNGYRNNSVGDRQSEMELYRNGIEWIVEGDDELGAEIGLEFKGEKNITGYDGVFEVGEEVWDWLEYLGYKIADDLRICGATSEKGRPCDLALNHAGSHSTF